MRRKGLGSAFAAVLMMSLFVAPEGVAAGRNASEAPALGATNLIHGSSVKSMLVRLPTAASVRLRFGSGGLELEGSGKVTGIVLSRIDVDNFERPILVFLRTSLCGEKGCDPIEDATYLTGGDFSGKEKVRLPAGTYILYLVADGKPVMATLHLSGVSGRAVLKPSENVQAGITKPPVNLQDSTGNTFYSSGQVVDFDGASALWSTALRMHGDAWVAGKYGHCVYRGDPPPSPVGFSPNCPGGSDTSIVDAIVRPIPYETVAGGMTVASEAGRWGFGDYYESVAVAREPSAVAFYLSFGMP